MVEISVSYVSNLPLQGDSPKVRIDGKGEYYIEFIDNKTNQIIFTAFSKGNETVIGKRQWFTDWKILVRNKDKNGQIVFEDIYNAKGKMVFIKMDSYALGDNIAWMPYVDKFREKHHCNIICSTFWNNLFVDAYPNILFAEPNTKIQNIYAQYYIGALKNETNLNFCPISSINNPLQMIASISLGLKHEELIPRISRPKNIKNRYQGKYVCISEFASHKEKMWREMGGWQTIVDFLNSHDYKVVVISKEKTNLNNVVDKTGDYHLDERINDLIFCDFFIGVSSGLSCLAWALHKKVVMISDYTPHNHEFQHENLRIGKNVDGIINYHLSQITSKKEVIEKIKTII